MRVEDVTYYLVRTAVWGQDEGLLQGCYAATFVIALADERFLDDVDKISLRAPACK